MNLERKTLNQFLRSAKVLTGKNALSVLNTVAVRVDDDAIHLKVNQLTTWLTADIPFLKEKTFQIVNSINLNERLYPVTAITAAASAKRGKTVEIEVIDDFLHIDGVKIHSSGISLDKFPELQFPKEEIKFIGRIQKFDNLIEVTDYVSADETRYFMNGVFFDIEDGKVTAVATDGRVLYKSDPTFAKCEHMKGDPNSGFIIHDFRKHYHLRLERFQLGEKGVKFYDDVFSLFVVYIDGQFPNYNRVVPDPQVCVKWEFNLDEFKEMAQQLITQARMHDQKKLDKLRIVMTDYESHIAPADKDKVFQPIGDKIQFKNSLPGGEYISFNMKYLMMMLNTDNDAEFFIHASTPESKACYIKDHTRESLKIVMPMMVRD